MTEAPFIFAAELVGRPGQQGLPGPGAAGWTALQAVTTGSVRQAPDGSYIKSTGNRTTRASFDATEQGFWTAVLATNGTIEQTALAASIAAQAVEQTGIKASGTGYEILYEKFDANNTASAWREVHGTADFSGNKDPLWFRGWNADKGLGAGDAAEPAFYMGMEADYRVSAWNGDATAHRVMEWYVNYNTPDGSTVTNFRPLMFSLGAEGNSATHWATISLNVGNDNAYRSVFQIVPGNGNNPWLNMSTNGAVWRLNNYIVGTAPFLKMGTAGEDLKLTSDSSTQASLGVGALIGGTQLVYFFVGIGGAGSAISINTADNLNAFTAKAFDAGQPAIVGRGKTSQTGDLFQAQDSSSTVLFAVTATGLPKWTAAGNAQTTVGAAGGASALPATPTKYLKVKDSAGTTLVIPAYAS